MEIVKIVNENYKAPSALENVINYVTNKEKTNGYIGGYGVNPCDPAQMILQMEKVKEIFGKTNGFRQIRHFIVSFDPTWQVTADMARQIAYEIARFYMGRYQICFGVHLDKENIHIHFVMNSESYVDGKLYSGALRDLFELKQHVKNVLNRNIPALQITVEEFLS